MKTRLALAKDMGVRYNGIFDCMRRTVAEEGVRGLYNGFVNPPKTPSRYQPLRAPFLTKTRAQALSLWVVIPYVAIQMTTFDVAQRKFRAWASDGKTKIPNRPAISASDISTPSRLFFRRS